MARANCAGGEIKGEVTESFVCIEQTVLPQGRVSTPEATDRGAGMPADKIQLRETRDVGDRGSTEVDTGTSQNVAEGAIESSSGRRYEAPRSGPPRRADAVRSGPRGERQGVRGGLPALASLENLGKSFEIRNISPRSGPPRRADSPRSGPSGERSGGSAGSPPRQI
ncbi:hypothetical protein B0H10DRAFT_2203598 [Mycena sp. CBHHK59/15]|nr:hypothetical protein B0H10DRAFT_2203598 [Mycena sp. CBHHK59/15]